MDPHSPTCVCFHGDHELFSLLETYLFVIRSFHGFIICRFQFILDACHLVSAAFREKVFTPFQQAAYSSSSHLFFGSEIWLIDEAFLDKLQYIYCFASPVIPNTLTSPKLGHCVRRKGLMTQWPDSAGGQLHRAEWTAWPVIYRTLSHRPSSPTHILLHWTASILVEVGSHILNYYSRPASDYGDFQSANIF